MYYWTRILSTGGVVACDPGHLSNYYCYRPGISTEVNRTPVLTWAGESEQLASIMCKAILEAPQSSHTRAEVGRVRAKFLALTTSNQFAWNALRGASKLELTKSFFRLAKTVFGNMAAPARVLSALLLPRSSLEKGILKHARKLAALEKQRQSQER